jgi:hypothetical protein
MRHARSLAVLALAALLLAGCSQAAPAADQPIKKPANVASGPETLLAAPTAVVEDTPSWTELPKPVASVFGDGIVKAKFQAFAAMKQSTVAVALKKPADVRTVFRALDAATSFVPADYTVLLNIYAPDKDGKARYQGYSWIPLSGRLTRKSSADADQSWDSAITAITDGYAADLTPDVVKKIGAGQQAPPALQ